ncbi:hypothetical protein CW731_02585 [Polaribacter sp. ALD11]|uniref:hypothetical protein n=1 Tax=Polaribacter sp. ALD11 TaxID=2058137 RepID=UPI000C315E28|nr:hypothetical protein [Polaribacter sp. ALD11]AUC84253.1 hypothetical protein CW731_02585 [Polaribacter sp. ALD11]
MKKKTLLLVLTLVSTFAFSQNKQGGSDPISGIDIIIKKNPGSQPIVNKENNPLISQINKLETEYLNLELSEVQKSFETEFYRIEGHLGKNFKSENEIYTAYVQLLNVRKTPGVYVEETTKRPTTANKKRTSIRDAHDRAFVNTENEVRKKNDSFLAVVKTITNRKNSREPIKNLKQHRLIDQVNKSEFEYLNLKAREIQNNFSKQDLSKLKTEEEVFKGYISYLSIKIKELHIKINWKNNSVEQQSLRRRKAKQHIILPDPKTKN